MGGKKYKSAASFGHRTRKEKPGHNGGTEGANVVQRHGLENFTSDVGKDRTSEAEWFFHPQQRIRQGLKTSNGNEERPGWIVKMLEPLGHIFFLFYFEDWMPARLFMPCSISVKSWISGHEEVKFCSSGKPLRRKRLWLLTLLKSLSFPVIGPLFVVGSEATKSQPLRRCGS